MKEGEKLCGIVKEVKMGRCFYFIFFWHNTGMTAGVHKSLYFSISLATHKTSVHKDLTCCFKLIAKGPAAVFHRERQVQNYVLLPPLPIMHVCAFSDSVHSFNRSISCQSVSWSLNSIFSFLDS